MDKQDIINFAKENKVKLSVTWWDDEIWLNKIIIPASHRGEGLGSKILDMLKEYCDERDIPMKLVASSCYGTNIEKLTNFYKHHGFEEYEEPSSKDSSGYMKYTPNSIDK